MKAIIKILNRCILFIFFIISLTSCKKETKQVNDEIIIDTIRVNKLGLLFEKSENNIVMKIVSLDSTSSENFHFYFQEDKGYYIAGKQNIFGYFNLEGERIFDTIEFDNEIKQSNTVYDSTLKRSVIKLTDKKYEYTLREYPQPNQECKFIYTSDYLLSVYLRFGSDEYLFDLKESGIKF